MIISMQFLEFITSNESNDVIDSTNKSYSNINQTHHQPITIPHLAQHPSSGIDVTSQIVTPYMMSNLQYTPIMTTQSNPVTTMAGQSGYGAASSYQQQSVLSQMTGHFGGSPNLSGGSPYLTNLSGGSPNSGNQLGASPNLTGQVGGSPNLGSQLGASPSQIGGSVNLGGTPRMMRKPGFMMEILR